MDDRGGKDGDPASGARLFFEVEGVGEGDEVLSVTSVGRLFVRATRAREHSSAKLPSMERAVLSFKLQTVRRRTASRRALPSSFVDGDGAGGGLGFMDEAGGPGVWLGMDIGFRFGFGFGWRFSHGGTFACLGGLVKLPSSSCRRISSCIGARTSLRRTRDLRRPCQRLRGCSCPEGGPGSS